jgi:hypothetical protein
MEKHSEAFVKRTKMKLGGDRKKHCKVGEVVQVPLVKVDRAKVDCPHLTGVIVFVSWDKGMVKVGVKDGMLKGWYAYHRLNHVKGMANNAAFHGLEHRLKDWIMAPALTEREADHAESLVGGHGKGMVICSCKGKCNINSCSWKKAGRICSSACHRNKFICVNRVQKEELLLSRVPLLCIISN